MAYYMPRDSRSMPICAPEKSPCVIAAVTTVEESAYDSSHASSCGCLVRNIFLNMLLIALCAIQSRKI